MFRFDLHLFLSEKEKKEKEIGRFGAPVRYIHPGALTSLSLVTAFFSRRVRALTNRVRGEAAYSCARACVCIVLIADAKGCVCV